MNSVVVRFDDENPFSFKLKVIFHSTDELLNAARPASLSSLIKITNPFTSFETNPLKWDGKFCFAQSKRTS